MPDEPANLLPVFSRGALLAQYGDSARTPPEAWNVTAPVAGLVLKVNQESETIVQRTRLRSSRMQKS